MCLLIESIKIDDGKPVHIRFHRDRLNKARNELFGCDDFIDPVDLITVPPEMTRGMVKCRIKYRKEVESIEYEVYTPKLIRSLRMIRDDRIDYLYKYADRSALENLFALKEECDDILIVKNGLISDTSSANVVFASYEGLFTPVSPLLKGTQRQYLLELGTIQERNIRPEDLKSYKMAYLINAMVELYDSGIEIKKISGMV